MELWGHCGGSVATFEGVKAASDDLKLFNRLARILYYPKDTTRIKPQVIFFAHVETVCDCGADLCGRGHSGRE